MPGSNLRIYGFLWDTRDGRCALLCPECAEANPARVSRLDAHCGPPKPLFYWDIENAEPGLLLCDLCDRDLVEEI
ncbi:protein of unknown function [Candidatus Hydrogenisulfobacillus filiaventi]|uniref:Uncharacterized protein n=1 Tax=Candidatus Hydrogenisulfobacillus filiaventi TaxID=2707344 RepID=A0A6F8ZI00_9FIRM|nr:protein of unknown function [Candidatus Hydrogenisulfobacillus filiaventi]